MKVGTANENVERRTAADVFDGSIGFDGVDGMDRTREH